MIFETNGATFEPNGQDISLLSEILDHIYWFVLLALQIPAHFFIFFTADLTARVAFLYYIERRFSRLAGKLAAL